MRLCMSVQDGLERIDVGRFLEADGLEHKCPASILHGSSHRAACMMGFAADNAAIDRMDFRVDNDVSQDLDAQERGLCAALSRDQGEKIGTTLTVADAAEGAGRIDTSLTLDAQESGLGATLSRDLGEMNGTALTAADAADDLGRIDTNVA